MLHQNGPSRVADFYKRTQRDQSASGGTDFQVRYIRTFQPELFIHLRTHLEMAAKGVEGVYVL